MRYLLIPDATTGLALHRDGPLPLARVQALVGGGYFESIYATPHSRGDGYVTVMDNEDGIRKELAPTVRFPLVRSLGGVLRGPILIMAIDRYGDQRDITDTELTRITLVQVQGDSLPNLCIDEDGG